MKILFSIILGLIFSKTIFCETVPIIRTLNYETYVSSVIILQDKTYPFYILYSSENITGIFIETKDWVKNIKGYGGEINLQIFYDLEGKIVKINVITQRETEIYAGEVFKEKFLNQYIGLNGKSNFVLGKDIQGITGATISITAVNEIILQSTKLVNTAIFEKKLFSTTKHIPKTQIIKFLFLIILFLTSLFGYLFNIKIIRYIITIISIWFLGILYFGGLSISHFQNIIFGNYPVITNIFFWGLIGLTIITTMLFGRLYCGWLCPFGAVMELLYEIKHFIEIRYKTSLGKKMNFFIIEDNFIVKFLRQYEHFYRQIKYVVLILILVFPVLIYLEPFQCLFLVKDTKLEHMFYLITITIFCLLFVRLWCRYFCPLGGMLGLISVVSLFRLKIETVSCLKCDICKTVCPTNAIIKNKTGLKIIHSECILCNKCRKNCGPCSIKLTFIKS